MSQSRRKSITNPSMSHLGRRKSSVVSFGKNKPGKGRGKRDGTPDKDDESASNADSQRKQVIYNDDIAKLELNEEEMANYVQQMRQAEERSKESPTEKPEPVKVPVRKLIPEDQRPPVMRKVAIMKRAPPDAPLKELDLTQHMGPRFDDKGQLIPHSILGSAEEFYQMAVTKGTISSDQVPQCYKTPRSEIDHLPVRKSATAVSEFPYPVTDLAAEESKALKNWEQKMRERKRQQGYISNLLNRPVDKLVMNSGEQQRRVNEEKYLLERSIPFYDYGHGNRVGSEFWKQQEQIGDNDTGIHATLTQTEKGYAPPVEQVGLSNFIRQEKGLQWLPSPRQGGCYPWKGPFYEARRSQLNPVIREMCPHEPDFGGLTVAGMRTTRSRPTTAVSPSITRDSLPQTADSSRNNESTLGDDASSSGPSLLFGGQPARWVGDPYAYADSVAIEARVILETESGKATSQYLDITNDGTTVLFYRWKKLPKANPFGLVQEPIRKFYFDTSNGVLLPGETLHFPFIYKSDRPGFFTEQWRLETTPVLCGGAALVVTLRGVAIQGDVNARRRTELEAKLNHAAAVRIVGDIVDDLVSGIRERDHPYVPPVLTDPQAFRRQNPNLWFTMDVGNRVTQLQLDSGATGTADSDNKWNLRDLRSRLLDGDTADEQKREDIGDKLSHLVTRAAFKSSHPLVTDNNARLQQTYRVLLDYMDKIFCDWSRQRTSLGLPELDVEFPDPTIKKGKEKSKSTLKDGKSQAPGKVETAKSTMSRERTKSPRQQPRTSVVDAPPSEVPAAAGPTPAQPRVSMDATSQVFSDNSQLEELCRSKIYSNTFYLVSEMIDRVAAVCESAG